MDRNSFLIDLSESDRVDFGSIDFEIQIDEQRVFSAIWGLESQVNNGGFEQYFVSTDGECASFVPTALRQVGAHSCAAIVEQAIRVVSPGAALPTDMETRTAIIDNLTASDVAKLGDLDTQFYGYPDDLTYLLFEFVSSHTDVFGPVPDVD